MQTEKTVDSCFILPILPHKIGNVRDFWDDISEKYGSDTVDRLKEAGIKRLLAFLQAIPEKGDYLVIYMESAGSLDGTIHAMLAADNEYSRLLGSQFKDFTGLDLSREEDLPKLQLLMDWKDSREYIEEKNMLLMPWSFAMPLKAGKTEDFLRRMGEASRTRMSEVEDMLRHHDIIRNIAYLQRTPQGDFIVRHMLASNPLDDLIASFTACDQALCVNTRKKAQEYFGIDLADPKSQPHVELLFKWDEAHGFETAEQTIAYTE